MISLLPPVRRASLYSAVAFLTLTALLAIVTVLFGTFDQRKLQVLATTLVVSIASVGVLCCSLHMHKRALVWPAIVDIILIVLSGAVIIGCVWGAEPASWFWRSTLVVWTFALTMAYALALLSVPLHKGHRWLHDLAVLTLLLLATVISAMVTSDADPDWIIVKVLTTLAILVALETLVIPVLGRMRSGAKGPGQQTVLSLVAVEDGVYRDGHGQLFAVRPLPGAGAGSSRGAD